jgi:hypothetical protein
MNDEMERDLIRQQLGDLQIVLARVDERLENALQRMEGHSERLDTAAGQVAHLESQAMQAKYWLAGASAAVAGLFGIAMWIASNVPTAVIERLSRGGR